MFFDKFLTANDCSSGSIAGWTALEFGENSVNFGAFEDIFKAVSLLELRVRVVETVFMIFGCNFCEMLGLGSEKFHMFEAGISEQSGGEWGVAFGWHEFHGFHNALIERHGSVGVFHLKGASFHFFES